MTTGMERVVAAATGAPIDRIPVFCNLLDQGARELGMPLREYYQSGERVAEAQLRMRAKYGYDNVWSLFYVGKEVEPLAHAEIIFAEDGPPNICDFPLKSLADIERLTVPADLESHPAFAETAKCLRLLRAEAGGKYPIVAYLSSSVTLPAMLLGMERWMELLLTGPAEVRDLLLTKCSDYFRMEVETLRRLGVDLLIYSQPFGSPDILPMHLIQELTFPWMERDLQPGGVGGVVYYCGTSPFNAVIAQVIERFGIGVFYLSPWDDVAEAKRIVAGRGVVTGTINDLMMLDWSEQEVRAEVKRIIDAGKAGGRFAFGTLVMPMGIPERNIRAMLDAAYEFGRWEGT